eukprot:6468728-Prymnesium_polylepis.2
MPSRTSGTALLPAWSGSDSRPASRTSGASSIRSTCCAAPSSPSPAALSQSNASLASDDGRSRPSAIEAAALAALAALAAGPRGASCSPAAATTAAVATTAKNRTPDHFIKNYALVDRKATRQQVGA